MAKAQSININDVKCKPLPPGIEEIAQPYMRLFAAVYSKQNPAEALEALKKLPLEKRYITRVVCALGYAFCDFDTESLKTDLAYLPDEEVYAIAEQVNAQAYQFARFIQTIADFAEARQ